jgi:ferredoxin-NADP reductase
MKELTLSLHPHRQYLKIAEVRSETRTAKTFRLVPDPEKGTQKLAFFRAGQYLSIKAEVNGIRVTRPYSISSSPKEALIDGFYEITIRKIPGGFLSGYVWENWRQGDGITVSGPEGLFYYEPLRDAREVVGLAGGGGITPFRSMIKDIIDYDLDMQMTLLYGTRFADDIIFCDELNRLASKAPNRITIHTICSEPDDTWEGPKGFLSKELIEKLVHNVGNKSFFISGPPDMYNFLEEELKFFNLPKRRIRREAFGEVREMGAYPGFPKGISDKEFKLTVTMRGKTHEITAKAGESVLVAMERAMLAPPSKCRSGECGFCRSRLLSGEIFVRPQDDGRRFADRRFGYFHPCSSYPLSDLTMEAPRDIIDS